MAQNIYLTIHGHFYQPPRENPWLESIELQDSAFPFHNWNERIAYECYTPNSVSRIVDHENKILNIVNNYSLISYNIGPTLLSWLEQYAPKTYERIIESDRTSRENHSGHGNALAQAYNHIIMPLANEKDKYTQVIWGLKDFQYRFGHKAEGIWLAETAICHDSLKVLADCGVKFTILSPFQALRVRPLGADDYSWSDVSWGNIDPARAYRYFIKDGSGRYVDLFFYDGSISKSVAFESLLHNGDKFINRLKDGVSHNRNYDQLVNIATDGESYGHHTRFGDMALSYALEKRAEANGFKLTNYGEYLELNPPVYEVEIKNNSSWSCCHGVGRWKEDCGCSTGAQIGWDQKWRKPLREALDWLRDELIEIYEKEASKYLKDPWLARNAYIDVILDRNESSVENFCKHNSIKKLSKEDHIKVMKLLEMQRQTLLMYTSCGWFFAEISGIETVQILKYAARAMQIAKDFSDKKIEEKFLEILSEAQSNIKKLGNGRDIYNKFVKPSIITNHQIISHWAISSLFEDYDDETDIFCYKVKSHDYYKEKKGNTSLLIGHINLQSKITYENKDMTFALLHYGGEDFHCVIHNFKNKEKYEKIKEELFTKYNSAPLTEVIRCLDDNFGEKYYTLKDLFIEERRKIINILTKDQLEKFAQTYNELYEESKGPMLQLHELGMDVPQEFKIAAEYSLSHAFNNVISKSEDISSNESLQEALYINNEAKKLKVSLNRTPAEEIFSNHITEKILNLARNQEFAESENICNVLVLAEKLKLTLDLKEAQNIYFKAVFSKLPSMIEGLKTSKSFNTDKKTLLSTVKLSKYLCFNVDGYNFDLNTLISQLEASQVR